MSLTIKCDKCLKELEEPGALVFSPPSDDGRVEKLHLCQICWTDERQGIMLHRRFMGRKPVEPCPESEFPAPNDLPEGMTYGPVMVNFNQTVVKSVEERRKMTVIERLQQVFDATLSLPSNDVFGKDKRIDVLFPDIDELDRVELAMSIEEEFGSQINDGEEDRWNTIGDIVEFLNKNGIKDVE